MSMNSKLAELKQRLVEIDDLHSAGAVLHWDQSTYMPPGGAAARGRQLATLGRIAHVKGTDPALGKLLDELRPYEEGLPYESDDASLIRVARRDFERAVQVPPSFMGELLNHSAASYDVWTRARPADDFSMTQPYLEKTLDLSRKLADFFPGYEHIADPLIDFADYGMKASTVRAVFADLSAQLAPIVEALTSQPPADDACLHRRYPEEQQFAFGRQVIQAFGYDFDRGRQDRTHHPFMTKFSLGDVRITTRAREDDLGDALFSTLHESGHAMYEQNIRADLEATPLARGASAGVHESQSRLWENFVGRSRPFWQHFYPLLQSTFPTQLGDVTLDTFYRAVNKVQRSLIRTDADEVTYNLHVVIRFELELDLLDGKLAVRDLPAAWRERYASHLGISPADDKDGVLQDMHWFGGIIGGAFQGYALGNILCAQFFEAALKDLPDIPAQVGQGQFGALRGWLREHVCQHGGKFTAGELVQRVTGGPLDTAPFIRYLNAKYGELYQL